MQWKRCHLYGGRLRSTLGLDAVPSHSPSAPLILSKSHYNPTNPIVSHHDYILSGSPAFRIRIWKWAGGLLSLPLPLLRKLIPLFCAPFSSLSLVNALQARPPGLKEPALGRSLDIQSQAVLEMGFYWPLGTTVRFTSHLWTITEKHPRWRKNYWWVFLKYDFIAEAGGQGRKVLKTKLKVMLCGKQWIEGRQMSVQTATLPEGISYGAKVFTFFTLMRLHLIWSLRYNQIACNK